MGVQGSMGDLVPAASPMMTRTVVVAPLPPPVVLLEVVVVGMGPLLLLLLHAPASWIEGAMAFWERGRLIQSWKSSIFW